MASSPTPLKHLVPGWFAIPMGLCGLSLAWWRAAPLMGEMATGIALVCGLAAALAWAALGVASLLRWQRHPQAWTEDLKHPVRHTLVATVPVATLLLATVGVAALGPHPAVRVLWWAGSLGQFGITVWVMARWWRPKDQGGLAWPSITPALLIPVVGNVMAPLGGVALGHGDWATAQFGIGLLLWPVVLALLGARSLVQGPMPERLLPTVFILISPPAVCGSAVLQLGAPLALGWLFWGMALFALGWAATLARRLQPLAFSVMHWAVSFPLAALAALTLRLAQPGGGLAVLGPVLLALSSLIILGLLMATWRGLRDGSLLAPEPVAQIIPSSA